MADRKRAADWDARYRKANGPGPAAAVLQDNVDLLPAAGDALDLACGLGANALWLASHGFTVTAWDFSSEAIRRLTRCAESENLIIEAEVRDILEAPPPPERFDLIVVSNFLDRALCAAIATALRAGGLLFYETWAGPQHNGRGPANPAYRLQPGELPTLFPNLRTVVHRASDGTPDSERESLVAQRI